MAVPAHRLPPRGTHAAGRAVTVTSAPRWIIHLPTTLTSLEQAVDMVVALRDSLGHVTVIDFGETTLSEEDQQFLRTRVWCDTPGRRRRPLPTPRSARRTVRPISICNKQFLRSQLRQFEDGGSCSCGSSW